VRLREGVMIDANATFGVLKFAGLHNEVMEQNLDGTVSDEVKRRTYDLRSSTQGRIIRVSVPAEVAVKEFEPLTEVELVNAVLNTVANTSFTGTEAEWYCNVDDIVSKSSSNQAGLPNQPKQPVPKDNNQSKPESAPKQ